MPCRIVHVMCRGLRCAFFSGALADHQTLSHKMKIKSKRASIKRGGGGEEEPKPQPIEFLPYDKFVDAASACYTNKKVAFDTGTNSVNTGDGPVNKIPTEDSYKTFVDRVKHYLEDATIAKLIAGSVENTEIKLVVSAIAHMNDTVYKSYQKDAWDDTSTKCKKLGLLKYSTDGYEEFKAKCIGDSAYPACSLDAVVMGQVASNSGMDDLLQLLYMFHEGELETALGDTMDEYHPETNKHDRYVKIGNIIHAAWGACAFSIKRNELRKITTEELWNGPTMNTRTDPQRYWQRSMFEDLDQNTRMQDLVSAYCVRWVVEALLLVNIDVVTILNSMVNTTD